MLAYGRIRVIEVSDSRSAGPCLSWKPGRTEWPSYRTPLTRVIVSDTENTLAYRGKISPTNPPPLMNNLQSGEQTETSRWLHLVALLVSFWTVIAGFEIVLSMR